jgi:hypothetical protein
MTRDHVPDTGKVMDFSRPVTGADVTRAEKMNSGSCGVTPVGVQIPPLALLRAHPRH